MVDRCNAAGVRIYVDAVINHMCGVLIGKGKTIRNISISFTDYFKKIIQLICFHK